MLRTLLPRTLLIASLCASAYASAGPTQELSSALGPVTVNQSDRS